MHDSDARGRIYTPGAQFEYGATEVSEHPTTELPVTAGSLDPEENARLTGLRPSTTYHFRIVASAGGKHAQGATQTFTTGPGVLPIAYETAQGELAAYFGANTAVAPWLLEAPTSPAIVATEGTEYQVAFSNSALWTYSSARSGSATELAVTVMPGSSPAVARLESGGYEIAVHTSGGDLATYSPQHGAAVTADNLAPGSSPSIAALPGGWIAAAVATSGTLETISSSGAVKSTQYAVAPDTSPSIVALTGGAYQVAFQSSSGSLWTYSSATGVATRRTAGLMPATSPSIAWTGGESWVLAYQAATGKLWTMGSSGLPTEAGSASALMPATSPSIAATGSGWDVAFQNTEGHLQMYSATGGPSGATAVTPLRDSSPSITTLSSGGYAVAYVGPTGELSTYRTTGSVVTTTGHMMQGTSSPSIATGEGTGQYVAAAQTVNGELRAQEAEAYEEYEFGVWRGPVTSVPDMAIGTDPDTTGLYEAGRSRPALAYTAFQATDGEPRIDLDLIEGSGRLFKGAVMPGTSPAATITLGARSEVAYQGTNGDLWTWDNEGTEDTAGADLGHAMRPDSSPSVAALHAGGVAGAFVDSTGKLWSYSTTAPGVYAFTDTGVSVLAGTSPSILATEGSNYDVAVQDGQPGTNYGKLLVWRSAQPKVVGQQELMPGTNPSIASLGAENYTVSYQSATGELWRTSYVAGLPEVNEDLGAEMMWGTSPSVG